VTHKAYNFFESFLSWDADAVVEDVTDEDGEVSAGSPKDNVWQVQAHQASSISCLRWNPVDSQTVSSLTLQQRFHAC